MKRILIVACSALTVLVSCVSHKPYQPASKPEKAEFASDRLDVYPDDVRKDTAAHEGAAVVWAGIIQSTDAREQDSGDAIVAETVFEHHYFDWVQDRKGCCVKLSVSPRGEGLFRTTWHLNKTGKTGSAESAEKYAGAGKLAIVYGVPEKVDKDGTVVLKYRYLRILDPKHFSTNEFDYGRLGEPFRVMHGKGATNSPPVKGQ